MSETNSLYLVPIQEIRRLRRTIKNPVLRAKILADVFRLNTLYMITRAGSGHIGTSFSSLDIVTWLFLNVLKNPNEIDKRYHDTYFSSKGHDVPGLYSVLTGLEKLDFQMIHKLRRLGGLDGHPDVKTPYMITNTGPLGMGISKARGMAYANRAKGQKGRFYVLCGDGELQEGQIWESLQPTVNNKFSEITVIVDHNKIQSDTWVKNVSDLGGLEAKFKSFGWAVARSNGHDIKNFAKTLKKLSKTKNRPKVLIADTVKGKGVSFMEKTDENGLYKFHAGAPSYQDYQTAQKELENRINLNLKKLQLSQVLLDKVEIPQKSKETKPKKLVEAYGEELVKIAKKRKDIFAIDCDLIKSCGLIPFKNNFPKRFIECGIAEQDAVSTAGGLALGGELPIVHSLACFLSTRPNEQIYNNATERKKIIYVGSQAGLLPAGPGHSHQSVRDISALGSVPGLTLIEPATEEETRLSINWAVFANPQSTYIRLVSVPTNLPFEMPIYKLEVGKGVFIKNGKDVAIISYGPTMLKEAYLASKILGKKGINMAIVNLPWLNRFNQKWFAEKFSTYKIIFTLDDHYIKLGQGEQIAALINSLRTLHLKVISFGLEEIPACGANEEVLKYHRLDSLSLAKSIQKYFA